MKKLILLMLALVMASFTFVYADTVQVGTGTSTSSYLPLYGLYGYNYTQQIYTQAQIGVAGNITKIRFYYVSGTITNSKDWVVYMGHTTKTTFATTTDWEPLANLTQVFAGDVTSLVPLANNWMEITLSTPFAYNNTDNLIVAVDENTAGYASMSWGAFTSGTNTGIYYYSDTINPDPAAPPTASSRTATIDRMQFVFPNSAAPLAPTLLTPANGGWSFLDGKLYWTPTAGGSDANTYDVYFGTSATPPLVSDNQVATNYTPTLAANTTYWWKVTAANEIGDSPASATWSFTTPSATQLAESFELTAFPPAGWANGTTGTWSRSTSYAKHGTASAYKYGSTTTAYVLSTPRLTIEHGSTLDIWTLASSATGTLQVVYSPDRVTWTPLGTPIAHAATYVWYNTVADLSSLAGNNYYLGIQTGLQSASFYVDLAIAPEITPEAPGAPALSAPADLATNVNEYTNFTWTAPVTGGVPTGYKLYVDTVNPPVAQVADLNALTYTLNTPLAYNTTYYWTVEALNGAGTGPQATVRSFTTRANPTISTFPWEVNFGTLAADWPVLNWSQLNGLYGSALTTGTQWFQDDFANVTTPLNKSAKINIYGTTRYGWLVTPPIAIPAAGYELKFDIALTDYAATVPPTAGEQADDKFIVFVDDNPNMTSPTILREWNNTGSPYVYDNVSNTGENHIIDLDAYTGTVYFAFYGESSVLNGDNDFFVDNVIVRETPSAPIFSYAPTAIDFGTVMQGVQTAPQAITITNIGGGELSVNPGDISITGPNADAFTLNTSNLPALLIGGQSTGIYVSLNANVEGPISATITIMNDGNSYEVALTANALPAGIVVIGNGASDFDLPINAYFGYTYSQSIFLQSEINVPDQRIESVYYYWNGLAEAVDSNDWTIYMGHTAATEFASTTDWMPLANLSTVFSGTIALPATAGWIEIPLTSPFVYNNTDNLVIAVDENAASYDGSSEFFYSTAAATNRSLRYYSDSTNPDPAAPVEGTLVLAYPNVMLQFGDIPIGGPDPVVITNPANEATGLPIGGFDITWTPASTGGIPTYYAVYMSTDEATIYDDLYWETTNTSFNPVTDGGVTFDYLDRWYYTVQAFNDDGDALVDPPYWFEIEDAPQAIDTFPYVVDFEAHAANTLPSGWSRSSNATGWQVGTNLGSTYWAIPAHTVYAAANDDAAGSAGDGSMDLLVSPYFDFTGVYEGIPLLTFDSFYPGAYSQLAYLEVSTNGTDWTVLQNMVADPAWQTVAVSLADYDDLTGIQIRFHADDAGAWASGWAIDNINISYINVDMMDPLIGHYPVIGWPQIGTDIPIYAEVTDDLTWNSGIASVTLSYSVDGGAPADLPMSLVEGLYTANIPGQVAGSLIAYNITAVDASAQANTITTATWDFYVDSPVWLQYDNSVVSTSVGLNSGTFGIMTGFENPFGPGAPLQINSITGQFSTAVTANVHVYVYDGSSFIDVIPSFNQAFAANVLTTIPLTGCTTDAGVFYVAYTDVVGPAYHAIDQTQPYYPGTHFVHFGAGMTVAGLSTIEGAGFPGSWFIRANVQAGSLELDAPVVAIAADGTLSWAPVAGAGYYTVSKSADPYGTFDFVTNLGSEYTEFLDPAFPEGKMFYQVTAAAGAPTRANVQNSRILNGGARQRADQTPKSPFYRTVR